MYNVNRKWIYLLSLSVIWGSSFILIKKALLGFSPVQVGAIRIVFAALFLLLLGFRGLRSLSMTDWKWMITAGFLSSFFPPFLFALAQTQIDSGVTSIFNSLAPLFTAVVGILFFGALVTRRQILGVFIGLAGTLILFIAGAKLNPHQNYWYATFILLSALGYALNINIIKKHLSHLSSLTITSASFGGVLLPALIVLGASDIGSITWSSQSVRVATACVLTLAILGTGLANVLFNKLIKISSPVYAASVTYLIPLVAILWGLWDGEIINWVQLFGGIVILLGVYLVNKKKAPQS
ncbi:DMT family transporter [Poritiphilus flavus]|uniref:EamA family transporter n=1 Tax=Poritiphilus flavus TaxID=2697053 RepID=A0A6L9EDA4_9FLAO|nr:DMT family transporter [Poritiphilus flavus]NAS12623.1 EamA family transporter [Poritiphilus flavus]